MKNLARADLPSPELLAQQAAWLAPARSQLLRRVMIARRRRVLDLGAGYGAVTGDLVRRAGGPVVALDRAVGALCVETDSFRGAYRVGGDAACLPFRDNAFDLFFSQITLLWMPALEAVLDEIERVLAPGGALVALEPDYGGMIEHPPELASRDVWLSALARAGADPFIGRKLPGLLSARGFDVRVSLFDTLYAPHPARFDFLRELPLTGPELARLDDIERKAKHYYAAPWSQMAHLPFFLITAIKS